LQEGEEPQYKDEIDCFRQLVTKEGPASLYSGLVPQLLGIAPEKVLLYSHIALGCLVCSWAADDATTITDRDQSF
jgi:hypothetical protein